MKRYYRDFYGSTASITPLKIGVRLKIYSGGKKCWDNEYRTEGGAKIAMARYGDAWEEVKENA